jgi:hypothetical protein
MGRTMTAPWAAASTRLPYACRARSNAKLCLVQVGADARRVRADLRKYRGWKAELDRVKLSHVVGCLAIDAKALKAGLAPVVASTQARTTPANNSSLCLQRSFASEGVWHRWSPKKKRVAVACTACALTLRACVAVSCSASRAEEVLKMPAPQLLLRCLCPC